MKKQTLQTLCTAALISLGLSFTAMGEERSPMFPLFSVTIKVLKAEKKSEN